MDIEKLMKEQYQQAEATPPAGAWDKIEQRLAAQPAPSKAKDHSILKKCSLGILLLVMLGGIAMVLRPTHEGKIEVAQNQPVQGTMAVQTPTQKVMEATDERVAQTAPSKEIFNESRSVETIDKQATAAPRQSQVKVAEMAENQTKVNTIAPNTTIETKQNTPQIVVASKESPRYEEVSPKAETKSNQSSPKKTPTTNNNLAEQKSSTPTQASGTESNIANNTQNKKEEKFTFPIPNVITPNYDGINDCWIIEEAKNHADFQVQIFTSKTKKVFESKSYSNDFCGDDMPDGQYFYQIFIPSINYSRRGVLVIKR